MALAGYEPHFNWKPDFLEPYPHCQSAFLTILAFKMLPGIIYAELHLLASFSRRAGITGGAAAGSCATPVPVGQALVGPAGTCPALRG